MPLVKYDIQAFQRMEHGGIPSYFIELSRHINKSDQLNFRTLQDGIFSANANLRVKGFFPIHFKSRYIRPIAKFVNPRISRIKNYDLVHSTYYHESFLKNIPAERHIVTIHDMIPEDFPEQFGGLNPHHGKTKYLQNAAAIICVSEYTRNRLLAHHPWISKEVVYVVHHGSKFTSSELKSNKSISIPKLSNESFKVLYVGSRLGYKNFQVLLIAASKLVKEGFSIEITCAGGGVFSEYELKVIHDFGLEGKIRQLNATDVELKNLYLSSHCQVTTSHAEGFGLPLLEAMSLGCPTIISSAQALQEVSGGSSLVFKPNDHEALANHLRALAENSELALQIGSLGLSQSKKFDWNSAAEKTISIYKHVLENCQ
jgi:glycosyltransferase involved in cell wall biosynthesis